MDDILTLVGRDVPLRHKSSIHGGEYASHCFICRCGKGRPNGRDHFTVWPNAAQGAALAAADARRQFAARSRRRAQLGHARSRAGAAPGWIRQVCLERRFSCHHLSYSPLSTRHPPPPGRWRERLPISGTAADVAAHDLPRPRNPRSAAQPDREHLGRRGHRVPQQDGRRRSGRGIKARGPPPARPGSPGGLPSLVVDGQCVPYFGVVDPDGHIVYTAEAQHWLQEHGRDRQA
jgi:hypothetical protein